MVRQERTEGQPERPPVKVKLGEPFTISPSLDSVKRSDEQFSLLDEIRLEIEDLGAGIIYIRRGRDDEGFSEGHNIRTPAGPVELRYILDNGVPKFVESSSPLIIEVNINRLSEEQLKTIGCGLIFDDEHFEGFPGYDKIELRQEGVADLYIDDYNWIDPKTQETCTLAFPPNQPEIFEKMQFVIKKKEQ